MAAAIMFFFVGVFTHGALCRNPSERLVVPGGNVGIIGGNAIPIEQAPYMALVRGYVDGVWSYWCSSSIIHEKFVLTAAHCIMPSTDYKVAVGTSNSDGNGGELIEVKQINVHPKFNPSNTNYDFCLIELKEPVTFSSKVAKIKLQETKYNLRGGTKVNATGWGGTKEESLPQKLQQVEIALVGRKKCKAEFGEFASTITRQKICAGNLGHGTCVGDSGGPLTLGDVQVGVTSSGSETCGVVPAIFSRISSARNWIIEILQEHYSL